MVKATTSQLAVTAAAVLSVLPSAVYGYAYEGIGFDVPLAERQENEPHFKALRERFGPAHARVDVAPNGMQRRQATSAATAAGSAATNAGAGAASTAAVTPTLTSVSMGTIQIGTTTTLETTSPLPTTYAAGATPSVSGAPVLPAVVINPADWPALDLTPPTDSPQVQEWMAAIDWSTVPNIPVTGLGGCQNTTYNAQSIADAAANGWWTCGGHTRSSDVVACPQKMTWGVSFDDGPSPDTPRLLDYLVEKDLKSTFFVVGSRAISRPEMLQYEYMAGNQISVHTWAHPYLTTKTNEEIVAELGWTKEAMKQILGVTPTTMRPPYGDIDDRVRAISLAMGLTPIIWTIANGTSFDTGDWQVAGGIVSADAVVQRFEGFLDNAGELDTGFIVLAHDLYQQSTSLAIEYILPYALNRDDLTLEPIYQCLGQDLQDVYIETASNTTGPAVSSTVDRGSSATIGAGSNAAATNSPVGSAGNTGAASRGSVVPAISAVAGLVTLVAAALAAAL